MATGLPWILPWQRTMTLEPVEELITVTEDGVRRRLTNEWREAKLSELRYVGITSALITSAFVSAIGWQTLELLPSVIGIWIAGLVLVLASIWIASSQSIALYRLGNRSAGLDKLCASLGCDITPMLPELRDATTTMPQERRRANAKVRKMQVLVWQMPVMLLTFSIAIFLGGLVWQVVGSYAMTEQGRKQMIPMCLSLVFAGLCCATSYTTMYFSFSRDHNGYAK